MSNSPRHLIVPPTGVGLGYGALTRRLRTPERAVAGVAGGAIGVAAGVGLLTVTDPFRAAIIPIGIGFVALVLTDFAAAVAALFCLAGFRYLHFVWMAPTLAVWTVLLGWICTLHRRSPSNAALSQARLAVVLVVLLVVWLALTALWAPEQARVWPDLLLWAINAGLFALVATTATNRRAAHLLVAGIVAGSTVSVAIGFAGDAAGVYHAELTSLGRLQAGGKDPNFLAASLVPSVVLAGAMLAQKRRPLVRVALSVAALLMIAGLVATGSRGGFIAAAFALPAAYLSFREHRRQIGAVALIAAITVFGAFILSGTSPAAALRFRDEGNGRGDLWNIAWHVAADRPMFGVGLAQFSIVEPLYGQSVGPIRFPKEIFEKRNVVHNLYLETLAEAGMVGLALLLAIATVCLVATARAARIFAAAGDVEMTLLARGLLVAQASYLVASVFISTGSREWPWIFLAFGPALAVMAHTEATPGRRIA